MSEPSLPPADPETVRFGLSRAIQLHSDAFRVKYPQVRLDLDLIEDENLLPEEACLALFQIYQARLFQVAQNKSAVTVWVHYYPARAQMALEIKDDGNGPASPEDIAGMKECAQSAGGQLQSAARPGGGTTITAKVPFRR